MRFRLASIVAGASSLLLMAGVAAGQARVADLTGPQKIAAGEAATGQVFLSEKVAQATPVTVQLRDSYGRIVSRAQVTVPGGQDRAIYALPVTNPIVRRGRIEAGLGEDMTQDVAVAVTLPPPVWDDYYAFVWAHYPRGFYEKLREVGINGAMVYREDEGAPVKEAGFACYVDQMCWEAYAWYHKARYDWKAAKEAYAANPRDQFPLWRRPCLHEDGTFDYVEANYSRIVSAHRDDHPMFYNLADEIGFGDQSGGNDFCWTYAARDGWLKWVQAKYRTLEAVSREWDMPLASWGRVRSLHPSTYWQYGRLWREVYLPRDFGDPRNEKLREQFGTSFASFEEVVALYMELVTSLPVDEAYVANWLKGIGLYEIPAGAAGEQVEAQRREAGIRAVNEKYGTAFQSLQDVVNFYAAFEKWGATLQVDSTTPDLASMAGWNLAAWNDFREYMDQTMADALARGKAIGRKYDPLGRFGFTGTHHPGVFSGQNYAKLCKAVDLIVPYNIGNAPEIIRSLYPDRCIQMTPSWFSGPQGVWDIWTRFLDGDRGIIFWDNEEPANRFFVQATGEPTERATSLGPALRTIESGLAKLLYASRPDNSGIALYYSHPSVRAAWWRQYLPLGRKWIELQSWNLYRDSYRNLLRNSWCRLIEDCNLQFDFVSHEQVVDEDRLAAGRYKVLILPETFALSDEEAARIRAFVAAGGIVIADHSPGVMDGHGKWRDRPALADLWDDQHAFLLDRSYMMYSRLRLKPGQERALREPIEKILFDVAKIQPTVRVFGADGQPLTAAEVHTYHMGPGVRMVSVGRSLQRGSEGPDSQQYRDDSGLRTTEEVTLILDKAAHVYDLLNSKDLGMAERLQSRNTATGGLDRHQARLEWHTPIVWIVSDKPLGRVQAKALVQGGVAIVELAAAPADVLRVARVEVTGPDGRPREHYAANVLVKGGHASYAFPFALDDPGGEWTIHVKDVATGQAQELTLNR